MASAGTSRRIDELGRVVLPADMRRTLGLAAGDEMLVTVEGRSIVLRPRETGCVFCDATEATTAFRGRLVCSGCLADLTSAPPGEGEFVDPVAPDVERLSDR